MMENQKMVTIDAKTYGDMEGLIIRLKTQLEYRLFDNEEDNKQRDLLNKELDKLYFMKMMK